MKTTRSSVTEDDVLTAAYACFTRHGLRRTTIDDIARELGRSRPIVYRFVTDKDDAFRKTAQRLLSAAIGAARVSAHAEGLVAERAFGVLDVKLGVAIQLHRDSPQHAAELLDEDSRLVADLAQSYTRTLTGFVVGVLSAALPKAVAHERAEILLALTRGLETHLGDPELARRRLRTAVGLLCADAVDDTGHKTRKGRP